MTDNPADWDCDACEDADRTTPAVGFTHKGRPACAHCLAIAEQLADAVANLPAPPTTLDTVVAHLAGQGWTVDGAYYNGVALTQPTSPQGGYTIPNRIGVRPDRDGVDVTDVTGAIQWLGHADTGQAVADLFARRGQIAVDAQRARWTLNQHGFGTALSAVAAR